MLIGFGFFLICLCFDINPSDWFIWKAAAAATVVLGDQWIVKLMSTIQEVITLYVFCVLIRAHMNLLGWFLVCAKKGAHLLALCLLNLAMLSSNLTVFLSNKPLDLVGLHFCAGIDKM